MMPSNLVENSWHSMSYHRGKYGNSEVLAAVYGPYESRTSSKSNFSKSIIEVVISDISTSVDHSASEKILSDLFSSVIQVQKYPYLSIMICIQIISKDFNFLSACINSAFLAVKKSNLLLKYELVAKDFVLDGGLISLVIVPKTDEILLSLCQKNVEFESFKKMIYSMAEIELS